jgi:hypothetical protein
MSTKIEMPNNLPPLPPVPEGYDRWEYRGMGWGAIDVVYEICRDSGGEWTDERGRVSSANGLPRYHYIEAVKDEQHHAPSEPSEWWEDGKPTQLAREPDMVNSPPHYRQGSIETIDAIKAALTPEEFRGYVKGNAMKYVWRERNKGGDQDLEKAAWYLNRINQEKP